MKCAQTILPYVSLFLLSLLPVGAEPIQKDGPGVALVLSGGGARGGAHIGVLKILEQHQIPVDLIVGTSVGALVGSLYATGYSAADIELILQQVNWDELLDDSPDRRLVDLERKPRVDQQLFELVLQDSQLVLPTGLQSGQKIQQLLDRLTAYPVWEAGNDFDRLATPFRAVATDILSGAPHVFKDGSLSQAVRASIAVPGLFTPLELEDKLLLDGGLADNLPVDIARAMNSRFVIAVDVSTPLRTNKEEFRSLLDVLDQAISIHIEEHKQRNIDLADVLITPELKDFSSSDFTRIQAMIPRGEDAARDAISQIEQGLRDKAVTSLNAPTRLPVLDPATFDLETYQASDRILKPGRVELDGLDEEPEMLRLVEKGSLSVTLNDLDRQVSKLYSSDRFRLVNYLLKMEQGETVLSYLAEKAPSTELGLGVRYDRDFSFTGAVNLVSRDLLATGNDLNFEALVGNVKMARVELPNRSFTPFQLVPSVYVRSFDRKFFRGDEPVGEYDDVRAGVRLTAQRLIGSSARVSAAYHFDRVNLDSPLGNALQALPESLAGVELVVDLDTLDDFDFPSSGWQSHLSLDVQDSALGGDFDFRRFRAEGSGYFPVGSRSVIGLSGRWGLTQGDVPLYEEFFTGGAHYFSFSAAPFAGLDRDQQRARQLVNLGVDFRSNWKQFQLGFIQRIDWAARYHAGIFSQEQRTLRFRELLHGFSGGVIIGTRFLGPIMLEVGGTSEGDFNTYVSIGHFF